MANVKLTVVDVVKLVELVDKVQKRGHYASVEFSNHGSQVSVYYIRNGFKATCKYDLYESFNLTDEDYDVNQYHKIVLFFTNIIEEAKEMTVDEIEKALGYKICIVNEKGEE